MSSTVLVRRSLLTLDQFCRATGLHPELVGRLVRLGLLDARPDAQGRPVFGLAEARRAARIARLRSGLSLNYAAIGLVLDLLDRIDALEGAQQPHATGADAKGGPER